MLTRRDDERAKLAAKQRMHSFYTHSRRGPEYDNPKGKNPGDFWTINSRPFAGAHFAVFPEDLCVRPILASCSQWVCKRCGKPLDRITEQGKTTSPGQPRVGTPCRGKKFHLVNKTKGAGRKRFPERYEVIHKTIGWAGCGCNAGFCPGIVLDPFGGSGTVGAVAKKLGRDFILIELNPKYCKMAEKRIAKTAVYFDTKLVKTGMRSKQ